MHFLPRLQLLQAAALALCLWASAGQAADDGCSSSLTTICARTVTPWKVYGTLSAPLTDVRLILQDRPNVLAGAPDAISDEDARAQAEEAAAVMTANGLATRYAGRIQRRADADSLPAAAGASQLLVLVASGGHGSNGFVEYVALLYEPGHLYRPIFMSTVRLGKDYPARFRDVSATELVNALVEAGLMDAARHTLVPIHLF